MLNAIVFQWRFWTLFPSLSIPRIGLCVVRWQRESVDFSTFFAWNLRWFFFSQFLGFSKFFQIFSFSEDFLASISEYLAPSRPLHLQGMELTSWNKWYMVHHHTVQISMDLCGDCWFVGVPNLRVWANISLLRRNWRFKLLHNGHEHIWHSHSSSVFSKSSGHDPMVTSQWEIKGSHLTVRRYDLRKTYIHLNIWYIFCLNAWAVWWHWLPWAFSVQLASSVNVLTPRKPEKLQNYLLSL